MVVGSAEPWWKVFAGGVIFATLGHKSIEDSLAQLGCIFFECSEWKILACRQNRRCKEESRAACVLQEPGLEQHTPCGAKLCQLWAAGELCRHCPHPARAGNSFYCCKSPCHASWKSLKVKSPLCHPTNCGVRLPATPEITRRQPVIGLLLQNRLCFITNILVVVGR